MTQIRCALLLVALSVAFAQVVACSAESVDYETGCKTDEKECSEGGELLCAPTNDPDRGCARSSCAPCLLAGANAICGLSGECAIAVCNERYRDCNGLPDDGCEVNTQADPANCGACAGQGNVPCSVPENTHVQSVACSLGAMAEPVPGSTMPSMPTARCVIQLCDPGWTSCDDETSGSDRGFANGCETHIDGDASNCGRCGIKCAEGQTCKTGICSS